MTPTIQFIPYNLILMQPQDLTRISDGPGRGLSRDGQWQPWGQPTFTRSYHCWSFATDIYQGKIDINVKCILYHFAIAIVYLMAPIQKDVYSLTILWQQCASAPLAVVILVKHKRTLESLSKIDDKVTFVQWMRVNQGANIWWLTFGNVFSYFCAIEIAVSAFLIGFELDHPPSPHVETLLILFGCIKFIFCTFLCYPFLFPKMPFITIPRFRDDFTSMKYFQRKSEGEKEE